MFLNNIFKLQLVMDGFNVGRAKVAYASSPTYNDLLLNNLLLKKLKTNNVILNCFVPSSKSDSQVCPMNLMG